MDRSLFSNLCSTVIWKPALEGLQTHLSEEGQSSEWKIEILQKEPDNFAREIVGQLNSSFSYFSKGIHNEWVVRRRSHMGNNDVRSNVSSVIKNITMCAAVLSFSPFVRQFNNQKSLIKLIDTIESEFGVI